MTRLTKYLIEETKLHPSLAPQDVVKLCYQAAFGAEHMLSDLSQALKYFQDEYDTTQVDDKPLAEYISPNVCRVNLSAWKRLQLNPEWLWKLFANTCADLHPGANPTVNNNAFGDYMSQADELSRDGAFPFSHTEWQGFISEYTSTGLRAVRHSAIYRDNERPAYRILSGLPAMLVPVFEAIATLDGGIIAIDGRAASGKTTLSGYLSSIILADVIAMDDFFLPPNLRTAERLSQPGGNIHHERFAQEVLPYLRIGNEFEYRKFDCSRMEYSPTPVKIKPRKWHIVEGVYSLHPVLGDYMDVRVFLDVQPAIQKSRIQTRNNAKIAADYLTKWIPMEEAYFKKYNIRETASCCISPLA